MLLSAVVTTVLVDVRGMRRLLFRRALRVPPRQMRAQTRSPSRHSPIGVAALMVNSWALNDAEV